MAKPVDPEKTRQRARIAAIEAEGVGAEALAQAWNESGSFHPGLRGRLRRAVAAAPALPPALAPEVLRVVPAALLANPALPLLLLEHPELLAKAPARFWDAVLGSPELSPALLPGLTATVPVERAAAFVQRPEFAPADALVLLRRLLGQAASRDAGSLALADADAYEICRQGCGGMLDLPATAVAALRAQQHLLAARLILVRCVQVSVDEALALRQTTANTSSIDAALAVRPDLPPEVLSHMTLWRYGLGAIVAANPSTPPTILAQLALSHAEATSRAALMNPSLPRAEYEGLLARGVAWRRAFVAARADLGAHDFAVLAEAGEREVREALAKNPRTPPEILARLGDDVTEAVRLAARGNPGYEAPATAPARARRGAARRRPPAAMLLERARPLLEGDMSQAARWREVLAWVEAGGPRPRRVPLNQPDRGRLVREGLRVLGEDLATWEDPHLRLLGAMIDSLGALPELNGVRHRAVRTDPDAALGLATAWMRQLDAAGYGEAESLLLLLDGHQTFRFARDRGTNQQLIARRALSPRALRLPELTARGAAALGSRAADLVDRALEALPHVELPRETILRAMGQLVASARVASQVTADRIMKTLRWGGSDFLDALPPGEAEGVLQVARTARGWQVAPGVLAWKPRPAASG